MGVSKSSEMNMLLDHVVELAQRVGRFQVKNQFNAKLGVDIKSTGVDLVTQIDKASEEQLKVSLLELLPGSGMLGEETGYTDKDAEWLWVVDPLDGTTNYAQGLPIYAVSIALTKDGVTHLACIYAPRLSECYTAIKGCGARLNDQILNVGTKSQLNQSVIGTGFPYDRATHHQNNANEAKILVPKVRGLRRMGAAAFDLAQVAAGRLDGYWEFNLSPWDVAAGALLISEARGRLEYLDARGVSVVAGNHDIVGQLVDTLDLKLV